MARCKKAGDKATPSCGSSSGIQKITKAGGSSSAKARKVCPMQPWNKVFIDPCTRVLTRYFGIDEPVEHTKRVSHDKFRTQILGTSAQILVPRANCCTFMYKHSYGVAVSDIVPVDLKQGIYELTLGKTGTRLLVGPCKLAETRDDMWPYDYVFKVTKSHISVAEASMNPKKTVAINAGGMISHLELKDETNKYLI